MYIDDKDAAIIEALRQDARASNAEISRSVGVSEGTIRRRLSRLLDAGAVKIRATPAARPVTAGLGAFIEINARPDSIDAVLEQVSELEEAGFVISVCGDCDIVARVEVQDNDALRRFLDERIRPIQGIERYEARIILSAAKDERGSV